jgi:hypothetical protein
MAVSPEYLTLLRTGVRSSPEWKEAWDRINDYLNALNMPSNMDRELILLTSFERAIARKRHEPFVPATELAFEEAQKTLDHSLGHFVHEEVPEERRSIEERVRLYLVENVDRGLLKKEQVSEQVQQALREVRLQPAPRSQSASITPKPIEFSRVGKALIHAADKLSPLGANQVLGWVIGLIILGILIYLSL